VADVLSTAVAAPAVAAAAAAPAADAAAPAAAAAAPAVAAAPAAAAATLAAADAGTHDLAPTPAEVHHSAIADMAQQFHHMWG